MPAETPASVAELPETLAEGVTGHLGHSGSVHTYLKQIAADINTAIDNALADEALTTVESTTITNIVKTTQAAYDALASVDANTFYIIVG